ncbi:MAG: hypothetical protein PHQ91_12690 [Thermoanaerobaculaceae bacterium]|nr:hypothetical protein [Thermoanaerobaculaceae bacterium]
MAPQGRSRDRLFVATVAYLLAPNVIFLAGWLAPAWGLATTVLVLACCADLWRRATTRTRPLTPSEWAFAGPFALVATVVAGIGNLNLQVVDYVKHNLVFHDLAVYPWPVVYPNAGAGGALLCYYTAYYLPASLVGKAAGLAWTEPASLLWGLAGVALAFAWIVRLGRPAGRAVLAIFMFVDGFAWAPGLYAVARRVAGLAGGARGGWWDTGGFTENLARFGTPPARLLFESEPAHLLWVPQHTIAAWLVTACVLRTLDEGEPPRHLGLIAAAALLWSPFVAVGLAPFLVMAFLRDRRGALAWPSVLGGLAVAVPVGLYFLGHSSYQNLGLLPTRFSGPVDWLRYLLFLVGSVGVLALAVALVRRRFGVPASREWWTFTAAAGWLVTTTLVVMGYQDDWVMRVSMPALMVFRLTVARLAVELWRRRGALGPRLAFAAVVLLSAERPIKTSLLAALGRLPTQVNDTTVATATRGAPTLGDLRGADGWAYGAQYLGPRTSWFARHVSRGGP